MRKNVQIVLTECRNALSYEITKETDSIVLVVGAWANKDAGYRSCADLVTDIY
jgi:hypothetical protein